MMNITTTISRKADFGMPMSALAPVARVRALPTVGGVSVIDAGQKWALVDATPVCGYRTAGDVITGAFPGTSAWRPPN